MVRDSYSTLDPPRLHATGAASLRILLVEDNLAEARYLSEVLRGLFVHPCELVHVKRLEAAIAHLNHRSFDVVLLDLTLPDSHGIDSLDALIAQAPQLPIVVLTNTNDDTLAVEAVRHGAQDYIIKRQVREELLGRSLRYAIERKQAAEALREANEVLEQRVQARTAELEAANQRLQQEVAHRQQVQERLTLAQKVSKIGTFEWHIPSHRVTWSPELEALYGQPSGAFADQYSAWLQTVYAEDGQRVDAAFQQAVATGHDLDIEFRIVWPNQDLHWIAVKGRLFADAGGVPLRMIGIHRDITDQKQLEAQFLRAQRLESLGTLASGIAHDLNNILTPILAMIQLLPMKLPNLDPSTRRMIKTVEGSAQRGAGLVKQILAFARGMEGKHIPLQVHHLLAEIRKIIQPTLPKSIDIVMDVPQTLWPILGDATQLHQVFMNLCVNARDAMPNGGQLTITGANVELAAETARQYLEAKVGPYVVVTITDDGIGMTPEVLHRIFDPFFTTKALGQGTGLGLSAVLGIVKSHGGFVDVSSQVGQGSTFEIFLPASRDATVTPDPKWVRLMGRQELILVVDDEVAICEITKTLLESYNYRVLTANTGADAIAAFTQSPDPIDCLLIGLRMPTMDGMAATTALRNLNPQLPVIAMSGLDVTAVSHQFPIQCQGFLAKPFTAQDLLLAIHQLWESPTAGSRAR